MSEEREGSEDEKAARALAAPFAPEQLHWRVGKTTKDKNKGLALCYIDARDVMDRLDEVFGVAGWTVEYREVSGRMIARITATFPSGVAVAKEDGAGDTAIESEKGGISDSLKRCAVAFGVGRYLYRLDSVWVNLDQYNRIVASEYPRLIMTLPGSHAPNDGFDDDAPPTPEAEAQVPLGQYLLMRANQRLVSCGREPDDKEAGQMLRAIISDDLTLNHKNLHDLQQNRDEILTRVDRWTPGDEF